MARVRFTSRGKALLIVALWLAGGGDVRGQNTPPATSGRGQQNYGQTLTRVMEILDSVRSLGEWEDQVGWLSASLENTFQRNGWNSDTDQFAKQVAQKLTQIPPWQVNQRLNVLTTELGQRWGLEPEQRTWLKERIFREALILVARNISSVSEVSSEVIAARKAGKPFTPEQVARWSGKNSRMRSEIFQAIDTLTSEVGEIVPEERAEIFQRDSQNLRHRVEQIKQMHLAWQAGRWSPEDWGLEADPIHAEQIFRNQALASVGKKAAPPALPTVVIPLSAWGLYVRNFIDRHSLDLSQQTTAWSILSELEERARPIEQGKDQSGSPPLAQEAGGDSARVGKSGAEASEGRSPASQPTTAADEQIAALFAELKVRLDAILTSAQRAQASADGLLDKSANTLDGAVDAPVTP